MAQCWTHRASVISSLSSQRFSGRDGSLSSVLKQPSATGPSSLLSGAKNHSCKYYRHCSHQQDILHLHRRRRCSRHHLSLSLPEFRSSLFHVMIFRCAIARIKIILHVPTVGREKGSLLATPSKIENNFSYIAWNAAAAAASTPVERVK